MVKSLLNPHHFDMFMARVATSHPKVDNACSLLVADLARIQKLEHLEGGSIGWKLYPGWWVNDLTLTLWKTNIANRKITLLSMGKSTINYKWQFSIAMFVYQITNHKWERTSVPGVPSAAMIPMQRWDHWEAYLAEPSYGSWNPRYWYTWVTADRGTSL